MRKNDNYNNAPIYRRPDEGYLAGVCAGIAYHFGLPASLIRFICVLLFFGSAGLTLLLYGVAAIFLPKKEKLYSKEDVEADLFKRDLKLSPKRTVHDIKAKFKDIENRIIKMEGYVSSREYELKQEFKNL